MSFIAWFIVGTAEVKVEIKNLITHLLTCGVELLQNCVVLVKNAHHASCVDELVKFFFCIIQESLVLSVLFVTRWSHSTAREEVKTPRCLMSFVQTIPINIFTPFRFLWKSIWIVWDYKEKLFDDTKHRLSIIGKSSNVWDDDSHNQLDTTKVS